MTKNTFFDFLRVHQASKNENEGRGKNPDFNHTAWHHLVLDFVRGESGDRPTGVDALERA